MASQRSGSDKEVELGAMGSRSATEERTVVDAAGPAEPAKGGTPYKRNMLDPFGRSPPPPPPESMDDAETIPLASASFFSKLGFFWITPLLSLGYKRTLTSTDLWKLDPDRQSGVLAERFLGHFDRRKRDVEEWNKRLQDGTLKLGLWRRVLGWAVRGDAWDGKRKVGMALALSDTFSWSFWSAGLFKIVGDVAQVCTPLLTRQLIYFVQDSNEFAKGVPGVKDPGVGTGVGLAIGVLILLVLYSVCMSQTLSRGGQVGVLARGTLIAAVYQRAMVLSGKSRVTLTNSKLVNHISTDVSRIDFAASFYHFSWTCIFQLLEVIIILLTQIGVSSLTAVALVVVVMPLQMIALKKLFSLRTKSMVFTDARIKLISELLLGIRVIKFFSWENPYLEKVHKFRTRELRGVRALQVIRAATQALALSIPLLASILVFVVYSLTGHAQSPAIIWTSISLLNLLRIPLMMLPTAMSATTDAKNALGRLIHVFTAETFDEHIQIDPSAKDGISVDDASFVWESSAPPEQNGSKKKKKAAHRKEKAGDGATTPAEGSAPSSVDDVTMHIPRGELWMICGPVGSGKSSLLQGLIGEMRRTKGKVVFGGPVAYCSQISWIMNTTVRENILFGQPWDEAKYWRCIRDASLTADLEQLPFSDMTEIGEKGIALSGGQRQRVSICRTLYYNADVVCLDDILSALDAHVGRHVFDNVIMGTLAGKTRLLATHAIHFMPAADRILCMDNGQIVEQGTYAELVASNGPFSRLAAEYGGAKRDQDKEKEGEDEEEEKEREETVVVKATGIMQAEEQATGSISKAVYRDYFVAANGFVTVPLLFGAMLIMQGSQVLSQFALTWWQDNQFHEGDGFYMGLYSGLGVASAIFTFVAGVATVQLSTTASRSFHRRAINSVLAAPMSMYDTTPMGRILNRFTKDVDNIDNRLSDSARMSMITLASIIGAFITVAIVQQWFIIAVAACFFCYWGLSSYYRASSREIKRIDNVLRSGLYAHFSESLAGLATIRAFNEPQRFIKSNQNWIDLENRAYLLTVINQRFLGVRLDFVGALLSFVVAMIAVGERHTTSPSKIGLVLSSIIAIQQAVSTALRQFAEVENNLASVERLQYYATSIPQESARHIPATQPPDGWPSQGVVKFKDVVMAYRPELPPVLKGVSFDISAGEKIGVVGRTGAGKSTLMLCLFRIVELTSGKIIIDDVDISKLGLEDLRSRIAIIPQEALLFNGTIRTNLDPFGLHDDAVLWSALQRASLVDHADGTTSSPQEVEKVSGDATPEESHATAARRFSLETVVEDEGLNFSVGERSLVSLARALVKDSQIILLDEATASIDHQTDARIQKTIASEFKDKTLLCIAHRLNTILSYDRVLVMDQGRVSALDTPTNLFNQGDIFYSLCVESGITLEDIVRSRR